MTEREALMRRIATCDFAITELKMFLDTHPDDLEAIRKCNEYQRQSVALRRLYESQFGPIAAPNENAKGWAWISNPWPWDTGEEG